MSEPNSPTPQSSLATRPPKRRGRLTPVPIAVSLIAVLLHIAFCAESPLIDSAFRHSVENWIHAGFYAIPGIVFSLPAGIALKLLPRLREKWAGPIAFGLCFGLIVRLASYGLPEQYVSPASSPAQQATVGPQREFVSTDGGYAIRFPSAPSTITSQTPTDFGTVPSITTASTFERNEYVLSYTDVSDTMMPFGRDVFLDAAKLEVSSRLNGSASHESNVWIGDYPGRTFSVSGQVSGKDFVAECQMYLVRQRFYKLIVAGERSTFDGVQAESFLTSFRLLQSE